MNSLERIIATVHFRPHDRTPVIAQAFGHTAVFCGETLGDYVRNGELLARCQLRALDHYQYDAVFALMDVNVEAEAVGGDLTYRIDYYPTIHTCALADIADLDGLAVPDPQRAGRMPELLKAAGILRQETRDQIMVVGCVVGPLTLALNLIGPEKGLYLAIDDPEAFARLLEFATETIIEFGLAQIRAGVHLPMIFDPSASPAVVPAAFFREFELPLLKKAFTAFKQAGAAANWLHIAGPVESILPYYPEAGVDLANVDYCLDPAAARRLLPQTCLDGNIRPLAFVDGTPGQITAESKALLDQFAESGGFILSSGCEIPPESEPANIRAMVQAAGR